MRAARVHHFGGPEVIAIEEIEIPRPGEGEVLVRVHAAGVGPWDAWIRGGRSVLPQPLPLTLGSDLSGVILEAGPRVHGFEIGQAVFGVTNKQFTNAYADYALASAAMIAPKPATLDHAHSAGVPVVAVTALQMLADIAKVRQGQRVLVLGAGGNVGAYAVQFALFAGAHVIGAEQGSGQGHAGTLGAHELVDTTATTLARATRDIDVVIDTVGGEVAASAVPTMVPGGVMVSSVEEPRHQRDDITARFMLVDVTTAALRTVADAIDRARIAARLSWVLPLAEAQAAHRMLAGTQPRRPGKIVLLGAG